MICFNISLFTSAEQMVNEVLKNNRSIEGKHKHTHAQCNNVFQSCFSHYFNSVCVSFFLAEFCLSCGKTRAATFHPLFEGGLCQTCKVKKKKLLISSTQGFRTSDGNITMKQ